MKVFIFDNIANNYLWPYLSYNKKYNRAYIHTLARSLEKNFL